MTLTLPTAENLHDLTVNADPQASVVGAAKLTGTGSYIARKANGNLPSTEKAQQVGLDELTNGGTRWDLVTAFNANTDHKIIVGGWQFNAGNRMFINTLVNIGMVLRCYSNGTAGSNYKDFKIGGNDNAIGFSMRGVLEFIIDPLATEDSITGTIDNTDITGWGVIYDAIAPGFPSIWAFYYRTFIFSTIKDDPDIPTLTAVTDWDDFLDGVQGTSIATKIHTFIQKKPDGNFFLASPWQIGDGGTTVTTFNDNGVEVSFPEDNFTGDPRFRISTSAFRGYLSLGASDSVTMSGGLIYGNRTPLDFNSSVGATVNLAGLTITGAGIIIFGSDVTGNLSIVDCDIITKHTSADLDNSIFTTIFGTHLLSLGGTQTLVGVDFSGYATKYAIKLTSNGTYTLDNCAFDSSGVFDIENTSTGATIINITNAGNIPTVTNTGGGTYEIHVVASSTIKVTDVSGVNIQNARVILRADTGGDMPVDVTVTITRLGSIATVIHTAHGMFTGDKAQVKGAGEAEYNGVVTITKIDVDSYSYTVSGTPTTPATGTIKATYVALEGLTDVNGEISTTRGFLTAQPVEGLARKASSAPYYKTGAFVGTVSVTAGFTTTVQLVAD